MVTTTTTTTTTMTTMSTIQVQVHGLQFLVSDKIVIQYPDTMTTQEIVTSIEQILQSLLLIDSEGYLNTIDLREYPVINLFIEYFTISNQYIKGVRSM